MTDTTSTATRALPTPVLPFEDVQREAIARIRDAQGTVAIHIALAEGKALVRGYYLAGAIALVPYDQATRALIREANHCASIAELRQQSQRDRHTDT